ncbi:hypothetical protein NPIL_431141 [Nephila pilipes]|uniref:Uncharacterized protein n=1 Tax=Nephila pilipes TaxID=299642 RepID=A0A8X6K4A5_NEPPI|nr:hypothetical protein NPIL_431141 [Nephila pilipes]
MSALLTVNNNGSDKVWFISSGSAMKTKISKFANCHCNDFASKGVLEFQMNSFLPNPCDWLSQLSSLLCDLMAWSTRSWLHIYNYIGPYFHFSIKREHPNRNFKNRISIAMTTNHFILFKSN